MALELTPELAEELTQEATPTMPTTMDIQTKGLSGIGPEKEGFELGIDQEQAFQPARVTGLGDGAEAVFGDSILTTAITGFNRGLGNLIDPVIYNGAVALRKIGEATGNPMLANIKPERNAFARVFASGDFETQNIMSNVLGISINYGEGADIGVTDEEGLASQFVSGAGKFAGEGATLALGTQLAANLATRGIGSYGANVLTPKVAPAPAPSTYKAPVQGAPIAPGAGDLAKQGPSQFVPGGSPTLGQKAYQKFDEFVTPGQTTTNVVDDIIRPAATNPLQMAALETGISGLAGGVTETTDSPTLGIAAAFSPAAIPSVLRYMPAATVFRYFNKFFKGTDLKDVALGKKGATEGPEGQLALNRAQKMIQEQLKLTPEESAAALARFEEMRAVIPELADLPIAQVYNNQSLIKTFEEAIAGVSNDQIPALNASLENIIQGVSKYKQKIGIEGEGEVATDAPLLLSTSEGSINLKAQKEIDKIGAENVEQESIVRPRFDPEKREQGSKFQKGLEARKKEAEEAVNKEKIRLGIEEPKRRQKLGKQKTKSGKGFQTETIQLKAKSDAEPEDVLALQKRVNEELAPQQGTEAYSFDELPQAIKKLIDWDSSKTFSFDDYINARKAVGDEINIAIKQNSRQQIPLQRLRTLFDDWAPGAFGKVGENYVEFLKFTRKTLFDPFEKSLITQITAKDGGKGYLTQSENAAKTLINKDAEVIDAFVATVKAESSEVDELKAVFLDNMYESAFLKNKGVWDADKLNLWMNNNKDRLSALPGKDGKSFLDEMNVTQNALNKSLQRRKIATERKETIEKSLLGRFFKNQEKRGSQDPEQDFLSQIINKPSKEGGVNTMLKIKNDFLASEEGKSMGKVDAENVFRRTIFEKLDEEQQIMQDPAKFKAWLQEDKNTQVLKDAGFSESHMKNLYLLADASERIATIPIIEMKGLNQSGMVERIATALGTSTAAVSTRVLAVKENRISPRTAFIYLASRAIGAQNQIRMDALMREAVQDPQLAKMLTVELPEGEIGRIPGPISRKVNNYLVGSGVEAGEEIKEEMNRGLTIPASEEQLRNFIDQSGPPVPEVIEERRFIDNAPPPPSMDFTQMAPPSPASTGGGQVKVSSLFPFDPLSAAIEERQQQKQGQGLGSLMA